MQMIRHKDVTPDRYVKPLRFSTVPTKALVDSVIGEEILAMQRATSQEVNW